MQNNEKTQNQSAILQTVSDFDNLYAAMRKCSKNVRWKDSVCGFRRNGIANCMRLEQELRNGTYQLSGYTCFEIHEPKKRAIASTRFKDRVVQRSLSDQYLTHEVTKRFVYDNGACLEGKGTEHARKRLMCHLQRFYRKHGTDGYVLQCDLKNFFGSTRHDVSKKAMREHIEDDWAYGMVADIIDSFTQGEDPEVGTGLGSQISQTTQLAVPDTMDHMIKEVLGIEGYERYNDDFILIHQSRKYLRYCLSEIRKWLLERDLKLNDKKTKLCPITYPIQFLGYRFQLRDTGKVTKRVVTDNIRRERERLRAKAGKVLDGTLTLAQFDDGFKAWLAHATCEPNEKKKGRPFIGRTDDYFRINDMKKFYYKLRREIMEGLNHDEAPGCT